MRKLANLKGAKALNKNEQKSISGGSNVPCTQQGSICCETFPSGFVLCEPGRCNYSFFGGQGHGCFWY